MDIQQYRRLVMYGGLGACPRKFLQNMTSILDDLVQFGWDYACCIEL